MITEGRLKGIIDQSGKFNSLEYSLSDLSLSLSPLEGVLYFTEVDDETSLWNESILNTCNHIQDTVIQVEQLKELVH